MARKKPSANSLINVPPPLSEEQTMQAVLRQAVYAGVSEADAAEVVKGIIERAKAGDPKSVQLFFDYILGGKMGPQTVVQQLFVCGDSPQPSQGTDELPGTSGKVSAMRERVARGEGAFSPDDRMPRLA